MSPIASASRAFRSKSARERRSSSPLSNRSNPQKVCMACLCDRRSASTSGKPFAFNAVISPSSTTSPIGICAAAATISGNLKLRSLPRLEYSRTRLPRLCNWPRQPLSLISCSQASPAGGRERDAGIQGLMKENAYAIRTYVSIVSLTARPHPPPLRFHARNDAP